MTTTTTTAAAATTTTRQEKCHAVGKTRQSTPQARATTHADNEASPPTPSGGLGAVIAADPLPLPCQLPKQ